jgi:hypothetical protein
MWRAITRMVTTVWPGPSHCEPLSAPTVLHSSCPPAVGVQQVLRRIPLLVIHVTIVDTRDVKVARQPVQSTFRDGVRVLQAAPSDSTRVYSTPVSPAPALLLETVMPAPSPAIDVNAQHPWGSWRFDAL